MSIKLMAAAWDLKIPSTEKMVLLALCDYANDHGVCWPSVPTIADKCSKCERTVRAAIKWLRDEGFCHWQDTPGKPHQFRLDPGKICTPANPAPLQNTTEPLQDLPDTPARFAPKPSMNHQEPPKSNITALRPEGVSDQVWTDFVAHRRKKRDDITATAMTRIATEAAKAGWLLEDALAECVARGWRGFKADWVKENGNGKNIRPSGNGGPDKRSGLARAIDKLGSFQPLPEMPEALGGDAIEARR